MTDETAEPSSAAAPPPRWHRWVRIAVMVLVIVILSVEAYLVWPHLSRAWLRVDEIRWEWVAAAIVAALASMYSFAEVQRVLLRSAGVRVSRRESLAVILASNSLSQTMPGGQVMAPAFIYRESRKWGASPVVSSWQLVMSGLLAGVGLAVLGLGGALVAGATTSPFSVFFSVLGFLAFAAVMQYFASHPEVLENAGRRVLSWFNNIRDKPAEHGMARLHRILQQLQAVKMRRRDGAMAFGWSFFNWIADVACLAFACYAISAHPGYADLMVAYAAGKAVGSAIPLLPGGIGVVDTVIGAALVTAGMTTADAVTAVIIYRIVSYILIAILGWVVIAFRYRSVISSRDKLRTEMELEEGQNSTA